MNALYICVVCGHNCIASDQAAWLALSAGTHQKGRTRRAFPLTNDSSLRSSLSPGAGERNKQSDDAAHHTSISHQGVASILVYMSVSPHLASNQPMLPSPHCCLAHHSPPPPLPGHLITLIKTISCSFVITLIH